MAKKVRQSIAIGYTPSFYNYNGSFYTFSAHKLHHDKRAETLQPHRGPALLRVGEEEDDRVRPQVHAQVRRALQEVTAVVINSNLKPRVQPKLS